MRLGAACAAAALLALAACRSSEQVAATASGSGSGSGSGSSAGSSAIAGGSAARPRETPASAEACAAAGAAMRQVTAASPVEGMYPGIAVDVGHSLQATCTNLPWPTSFADCLAAATTVEQQMPCVDGADSTVANTFRLVLSNAKRAAIAKHGGVAGSGSGTP